MAIDGKKKKKKPTTRHFIFVFWLTLVSLSKNNGPHCVDLFLISLWIIRALEKICKLCDMSSDFVFLFNYFEYLKFFFNISLYSVQSCISFPTKTNIGILTRTAWGIYNLHLFSS